MRYTFEEEFRLGHPETVGETDSHFDLDNYKDWLEAQLIEARKQLALCNVSSRFPDNPEIWKWWKEQKFQREQGEQEYTMIYEIDLPKILKAFTEHLLNGA